MTDKSKKGSSSGEKKYRTIFDVIVNQTIIGLRPIKKKSILPADLIAFRERFRDTILWVQEQSPRVSSGALAAITRGVLWYGREKMEPFCRALKHGEFTGAFDPAHLLFLWLKRQSRFNARESYKRTITAIRYYVDGRKIMRKSKTGEFIPEGLYPAATDLFEWDQTYTMMVKSGRGGKVGKKTEIKSVFDTIPKEKTNRPV